MRCALLMFLVACGASSDPHELGSCSDWTQFPQVTQCERACEPMPSPWPSTGATCNLATSAPQPNCATFEVDGVRGCCLPAEIGAARTIRFYECQ